MLAREVVQRALNPLNTSMPNNGWKDRHNKAIAHPVDCEKVPLALIDSLALMADLGMVDWFFRADWESTLDTYRATLNYDLGRLDGGTLDSAACRLAEHVGYDLDISEWNEDQFSKYRESVGY